MRGHPQEHLLQAWAGILQQQHDDKGEPRRASAAQLRRMAVALWTSCAGATLLSCEAPWKERYSRCMSACCMLKLLQRYFHCVCSRTILYVILLLIRKH